MLQVFGSGEKNWATQNPHAVAQGFYLVGKQAATSVLGRTEYHLGRCGE
jgi:hypothetical protein